MRYSRGLVHRHYVSVKEHRPPPRLMPWVEDGWSVIGVARSSAANFPGVFIEADLADRHKAQYLADELVGLANVVGIVNNVGVVRHESVDAVDPDVFAMVWT